MFLNFQQKQSSNLMFCMFSNHVKTHAAYQCKLFLISEINSFIWFLVYLGWAGTIKRYKKETVIRFYDDSKSHLSSSLAVATLPIFGLLGIILWRRHLVTSVCLRSLIIFLFGCNALTYNPFLKIFIVKVDITRVQSVE
jgi:hypothetical protein